MMRPRLGEALPFKVVAAAAVFAGVAAALALGAHIDAVRMEVEINVNTT